MYSFTLVLLAFEAYVRGIERSCSAGVSLALINHVLAQQGGLHLNTC